MEEETETLARRLSSDYVQISLSASSRLKSISFDHMLDLCTYKMHIIGLAEKNGVESVTRVRHQLNCDTMSPMLWVERIKKAKKAVATRHIRSEGSKIA